MVPKGWEVKSFEDVAFVGNGQVDPREEPYSSMWHIGPENVTSDTGRIKNVRQCSELGLISGKYEFDRESIVYSKIRPNLNKVCRPDFDGVCSADMYPIWTKEGLFADYLFYYMLGPKFYSTAVSMSMRTGMPKINRTDLDTIKINIPPLPEQQKIAKILSTWDKAISTTERLIENSTQQKKALMQQLLTGKKRLLDDEGKIFEGEWEEVKLSEIAQITMGSSPKSDAYNEIGDGLPLLQGNADIKNRKSAPRIYTSQITKECHVDDILFSVRAPVGTVALSNHNACIGRGIAAIKAKKNHSQDYLYQWLLSFELKWERYSQGSTFEAVNSDDIKSLNLSIPNYKEQQKIATVLTNADKEIELLEQQLADLQQEKKALMQVLLTGKKRVVVDEC